MYRSWSNVFGCKVVRDANCRLPEYVIGSLEFACCQSFVKTTSGGLILCFGLPETCRGSGTY